MQLDLGHPGLAPRRSWRSLPHSPAMQ